MSAELDKIRNTFADQLDSFDDRLESKVDDVEMLAEIQEGIGGLLAGNGSSEAEIRRILYERYEAGTLRKETFQLVKSMLDRYVTEKVPTSPNPEPVVPPLRVAEQDSILGHGLDDEREGDDEFGTTTVIPADFLPDRSAESSSQVGSLLRDRFLLQEQISGGSMGIVYKALDRRLAEAESPEPWVAIKVLSPQFAENRDALRALQQEATKGRCLLHPNIVRFIDLDRDDDLYFLIMEWLEGRTLADILDTSAAKTVDRDTAFQIVRQVGDALDYAHRCGIVHADVKPGNIMIMPNGDAKLFDFGVARVRQQQTEADFDPGILGAMTPAYSSMQVLTGEEPAATDDVFSLACLLYRLVAGHRVFGPRNAAEASEEGMKPQRPQGLNDTQWRALKKALSYARVTRFSSVKQFLDALDECGEDTISFEAPERFGTERESGNGKWLVVAIALLGLAGAAAYQYGLLDPWLNDGDAETQITPVEPSPEQAPPAVQTPPAAVADQLLPVNVDEATEETFDPEPLQEPLVDFSLLPPATLELEIAMQTGAVTRSKVTLREDDEPVVIDFVRTGELGIPLTLKLEEVGFSGNRSPWGSSQYTLSDSGILRFPVGQDRSRITLTMSSDPLREADQTSTLRLRETDSADSEIAVLNVTLEDDDQRAFEGKLPRNTIAFAASQASIRETDPAVQIDLVRFNPDDTSMQIGYSFADITATEGEDYFAPGSYSISFGPGQRSARLLIPLVQDTRVEGDEAFVVELADSGAPAAMDVYRRIVVMIRDDEPQSP